MRRRRAVLKALAPLGEDYVATVKEGFENRWIDVYENEGKAERRILGRRVRHAPVCPVEL